MTETQLAEHLNDIMQRHFGVPQGGLLDASRPPFDTSKPNIHDSKADFLAEVGVVDQLVKQVETLKSLLAARYSDDHPQKDVVMTALSAMDEIAANQSKPEKLDHSVQLVVENAARIGQSASLTLLLIEFSNTLSKQKQELETQRAAFWTSPGRAPNHYARMIALRLAKVVARSTGTLPTFGTARDGGHPSTNYGRALEEVFSALGIEANVKHPAVWAIGQLTDEDLRPVISSTWNGLFGMDPPPPSSSRTLLAAFMSKGGE